jgi:LETM1 and EF-hand domain-containing protein 1, mitochondrial
MMDKLDSMIFNLEEELHQVDSTIGDRLNFLDKDRDGVLSNEELMAAIKNILREHNTEEDAAWAVAQIDENKDGKVTVAELVAWIEKRTNLMELTGKSAVTAPKQGVVENKTPP